ncbi:plasmid segregation protein ParM [Kosakonia sacchari]|uniref:plasmid segregation protein ParM n=1 Tax=Kosakonia sacchari TaxID=1158459 RepID=UPI002ACE589A|nr:plasmid segregation protein ParM [Kosakonia sacchari]MDZ7324918.1 plasmid segregation protein ParM [Kosakonia sacchari]
MKFYVDDGSTNIKVLWEDDAGVRTTISPNSFKREWSVAFGNNEVFNYALNGEHYSFDPISAEALITTNVAWQYSDVNVVAVHHALLKTGVVPCEVDIVVTLPLGEFYNRDNQPSAENIRRKQESLMRPVELNGGRTFTVRSVQVMPESIPAGYRIVREMDDLDSLLIIDLGGTTLDISHVMARMRGISRIYGDSRLGVSLMTQDVRAAMALAGTRSSSYLADEIIIHRDDETFLRQRINDTTKLQLVINALNESRNRLVNRVIEAVNSFNGYSHVMVIGGGAELIAGAVRKHCGVRDDRFYISDNSQFDLVNGMYEIG